MRAATYEAFWGLVLPIRSDVEFNLSDGALQALVAIPRDTLQWFLIDHGSCVLRMPEAMQLWADAEGWIGWCRHCGATAAIGWPDVGRVEAAVWWGTIALALFGAYRETFTTADALPRPEWYEAIRLLEEAVGRAVLLDQAWLSGVTH